MKIKNILIVGLVAASLSSCNDFLDVDAISKYDNEYVFSDKTEVDRALNGVYAQLLSSDTYGSAYLSTFCLNSDVDMWISSNSMSSNNSYRRFDCTSTGGEIEKAWNAAYQGIEYANNFIHQLEQSSLYSTDDEEIMQMLGEAKVMRAIFYHDLVVMFGDVPFSFIPTSEHPDNFILPVTDREEIYKSLIKDLESTAPYMQFASDLNDGVERISKEMCWSMIARMALTCGGYSLRADKANAANYGTMERPVNYKEYYEISRQYCDSVISSATHSLNLSYRQVFINECNYIVVTNDDPIFEIPFAQNSTGSIGYIQGPTGNVDEGNTTKKNVWGESKGSARLNALYRYSFDEEDLRRDYVNGLWYYEYDGTPLLRRDYTVHNNKWSKFWSTSSMGTNSGGNTGINYPYMRYADVLLMYAEAVNELEEGVGGANGAKAQEALRQVRQRAFENSDKVDVYVSSASASKESFLKAVLDERKGEFAGENMRWRDLVRNNLYSEATYYNFLRYNAAAGVLDYIDIVEDYDGMPDYIANAPSGSVFYKIVSNPGDTNIYPNTSLDIMEFYDAYHATQNPGADWTQSDTYYNWWNDNIGCPNDQILYSFYGYIQGSETGNVFVINNGTPETPDVNNLPVVRYILPYPNAAIQRSAGVYKNYYGYVN